MTAFVLLPSLAMLALVGGHLARMKRARRLARERHDETTAIAWAGELRHMRNWKEITGEVLPSPVPPSVSQTLEVGKPRGVSQTLEVGKPRGARRLTLAHIAYANLALAALELVHDVAARWQRSVDLSGLRQPTSSVVRLVSDTIVSHRAAGPSWPATAWVNLRAWPLEPVAELERWWRTTHHAARHALGRAPGATAQRARWNASTGAWTLLQLRPAVPRRELEAVAS